MKAAVATSMARISQPATSVLLMFVAVGMLGEKAFGSYAYALNIYFTVQLISSLGIKNRLVREIARRPDRFWHETTLALAITIPISILGATLGALHTGLLSNSAPLTVEAALLLLIAIPFATLADVGEACLHGLSRFEYWSFSQIFENALRVGVSCAFLAGGLGVLMLSAVFLVARVGQAISLGARVLAVKGAPRLALTRAEVVATLRALQPFFWAMLTVTLTWRIGVLVLQETHGEEQVGQYDFAFRIVNVFILILQSIVAVLYPTFSRLHESDRDQLHQLARGVIHLSLIALCPFCFAVSVFAPTAISWVTDEFETSKALLIWMTWLPLVYAPSVIQAYLLLASHRQGLDLKLNVMTATTTCLATLVLVPSYGPWGALIALGLGQTVLLILQTTLTRLLDRRFWILWLSACALGAIVSSFDFLFGLGALAGLLVLAWVVRSITAEERESVRTYLLRGRSA